jgi:hypothetical protein
MHTCYADILLEKGKIKAEEIWDIYKSAPRVAQVDLKLKWRMLFYFVSVPLTLLYIY